MLDRVTPARCTVREEDPATTVTTPLRLKRALPTTSSDVPVLLCAETPVPLSACPFTPTPTPVAWPYTPEPVPVTSPSTPIPVGKLLSPYTPVPPSAST